MKKSILITVAFALLMLVGCAPRYKRVNPETLMYNSAYTDAGVKLEYKYDVLKKKYKRKESKKKVKVIAIKITNNGDREMTVGRDLKLVYQNGNELALLDNKTIYKNLKQHPATHLLYMLLTPLNLYTTNSYSGSTDAVPVGFVAGPALTLGNLLTASGANKKFRRELEAKSIIDKTIKIGETIYDIIGIRSKGYEPLQIKVQ